MGPLGRKRPSQEYAYPALWRWLQTIATHPFMNSS